MMMNYMILINLSTSLNDNIIYIFYNRIELFLELL